MAEIYNDTYCVYVHTNNYNLKKYVGITRRKPETRWNNGYGYLYNNHFYSAIKKYGWDGFSHDVIASNLTKDEAENFEKILILKLKSYQREFGYNNDMGGNSTGKISEQTRRKLSECQKGHPTSARQKARTTEMLNERWSDEEYKRKFGEEMKKKWSDPDFRTMMLNARVRVNYDSRSVPVVCDNIRDKNVKTFAEENGLNDYTVRGWLNGHSSMPKYWYDKGLRQEDTELAKKIHISKKECDT